MLINYNLMPLIILSSMVNILLINIKKSRKEIYWDHICRALKPNLVDDHLSHVNRGKEQVFFQNFSVLFGILGAL